VNLVELTLEEMVCLVLRENEAEMATLGEMEIQEQQEILDYQEKRGMLEFLVVLV